MLAAGCSDDTPTSPTETSTTATAAAPTITERFDGVVPVGGSMFYSFTTSTYGTINVTLTAVGGAFVPTTVMLAIGLRKPTGASFRSAEQGRAKSSGSSRAARAARREEAVVRSIAAHGTEEQKLRQAAGMLPMAEAIEGITDQAFAANGSCRFTRATVWTACSSSSAPPDWSIPSSVQRM